MQGLVGVVAITILRSSHLTSPHTENKQILDDCDHEDWWLFS